MYLLLITLYELGQFLRIVLWVFLPLFVIVLLITTYLHHRRKRQRTEIALEGEELLLSGETAQVDGEQLEEDNLYKGLLWMKQKFEEYRMQSDERVSNLKVQLDERGAAIEMLKEELAQAKEKIADLTSKLENNMSLLMNIHKELDRSLSVESPLVATPEAASGGSGELEKG
jgi:peptidoglycan hydrolase CwlO-like protein